MKIANTNNKLAPEDYYPGAGGGWGPGFTPETKECGYTAGHVVVKDGKVYRMPANKVFTGDLMAKLRESISGTSASQMTCYNEMLRHAGKGSGGYYSQASDIDPEMTARDYWSTSGKWDIDMPTEEDMERLIVTPVDNASKAWFDGTNILEEFQKEMLDATAVIRDDKNQEKNLAFDSRQSSDAIAAEMANAEQAIECANDAGGKVADGLWKLWDKVDKALNKMRVYTNAKGKKPFKPVATRTLKELGTRAYVQDEEDDRYLITWPSGESATMNLSAAALLYYQKLAAKGSLSMMKLARGGIINEPILGMGQKTGRHYLMGESGPETITPGANTSPGTTGGSTFNITINAKDVGDIERQLKPTILRILKESTSRAGIV
jgi:hypothetical protein